MKEKKENSASIKIPVWLLESLKDAQYEARKRRESEPTYAELLERAWRSRCENTPDASASLKKEAPEFSDVGSTLTYGEGEILWVQRLTALLRAGDERAEAVKVVISALIGAASERPAASAAGEVDEVIRRAEEAVRDADDIAQQARRVAADFSRNTARDAVKRRGSG